MIEQGNTEQVRALLQPDRKLTIFLAGCGIIGRVVVRVRSEWLMIVRYEKKTRKRTCGSVRSSLSAPARLATVGSEAAETTSLARQDEEAAVRKPPRLRASMRRGGRLDDTSNTSELPAGTVKIRRAKDADRLKPKRQRSRLLLRSARSTRTQKTAGVKAGTKSFVSWKRNMVNPTSALAREQACPQGTLTGERAEDAGKSKGRL